MEPAMATSRQLGERRKQLPEEVASYVRELIISGQVRPGEFLRMERIAEAVGVSNTPVREGLLSLRSEGFVRLVPRRGFVVAEFSRQDVRDLFWAQAQLAGELAARAAKKATQESIDALGANLAAYTEAIRRRDEETVLDLGQQFHRIVNRTADSHRLALLLDSVVSHLPIRFYTTVEGQVAGAHDEHPMIIDAIRANKVRLARSLMEKHILDGADRLIETLETQGLWSEEDKPA